VRRQLRIDHADLLEPHDHVAWYGESTDDLYAVATAALADGALRNEKLMLVADDPQAERLAAIDDLDELLGTRQLELHSIEEVYGSSGQFSQSTQLETFEGVLADALTDGYTGIRVVADNTRLASGDEQDFRRWMCWEQVTDRFQSTFNVTGVCYFDARRLSAERKADLAAVHPVRSTSGVEPPFSFIVDGDAVAVTGTLDTWSVSRLQRVLDAAPEDEPLVVDLAGAEFVDHRALMALNAIASPTRPVRVRRAPAIIRELASMLELATPDLTFERA
jgi:MEDS: MEthanogen/methylotroph, DcmR Sensory domain